MADLWFSFKMIIITSVLIVFMQIRIGRNTIEEHTLSFIKTNPAIGYIQDVAQGAVLVIRTGVRGFAGKVSTRIGETIGQENAPGERTPIDLTRSKAVLKDLAAKAKEQSQSLREEFRREIKEQMETSQNTIEDSSYEEVLYNEPVTIDEAE